MLLDVGFYYVSPSAEEYITHIPYPLHVPLELTFEIKTTIRNENKEYEHITNFNLINEGICPTLENIILNPNTTILDLYFELWNSPLQYIKKAKYDKQNLIK